MSSHYNNGLLFIKKLILKTYYNKYLQTKQNDNRN
jgi:hypothetical protein